jgi:hypothetical protein
MSCLNKEALDNRIINDVFNQQFEGRIEDVLQMDNRMAMMDNTCVSRVIPVKRSSFEQLCGYENLNDNTFHLQPEKKNTYHNYPVLQENGSFCTMNHQIFMNNTKRNMGFLNDEQGLDKQVDINAIIPGDEPMFNKMNVCNLKK